MAFYYLLLGHLIGDFVLQTDKIAENKGSRWEWNLLHVLVVTLCILAFSYPYGAQLIILVLVSGALHFLIDHFKSTLCKVLRLPELAGFILDQSIHILLLFLISLTAVYGNQHIIDFNSVKFLIVFVTVTSFSAVLTQFVPAAVFPRSGSRFFEDGEKNVGILTRLFVAIVFYLSLVQSPFYFMLLIFAAIAFLFQFKFGWNKWMSPTHLAVKLLLDTTISAACTFPFVLL